MCVNTLVHACAADRKSAKSDMGSKLGYIHAFGAAIWCISADFNSALLRLATANQHYTTPTSSTSMHKVGAQL